MKSFLNSHLLISIHLCIIAGAITAGAWVAHYQKEEVVQKIQENIDAQVELMVGLADTTDWNGADGVVGAIIQDCPRRNEFDLLLGRLESLTNKDLIIVQQLFESCGSFYAERKALMVSRLEREYASLEESIALLKVISPKTVSFNNLDTWGKIIDLEKDRSAYLTELTTIQGDIITALIKGEQTSSKNVQGLASTAQNISETLNVIDKQIDNLRAELGT